MPRTPGSSAPSTPPPPRPPGSPAAAAASEPSTTGLTAPTAAVEAVDAVDAAAAPGRGPADPHATEVLPAGPRDERTIRRARPAPLASWSVAGSLEETVLLPRPPLEQDAPAVPAPRRPADDPGRDDKALVKASGGMAVATLVSRLTGFLRTLGLTAIVGLNLVGSSFNVANTLPNIIFELLLGGVLTSVVIPVLVQAAKDDGDQGDAFAQKLLSGASVGLLVATTLAVVAAPLLIRPYLAEDVDVDLAVDFAYLLLPQIFFYGMGALFGAILNSRGNFGPAAWAPVLNNVVALVALGIYAVLPSPPEGISTTQLLVLGIGSTLGIVVQAAVMLPAMRRVGFRWKWRFGWDQRLSAFGGLAAWVVGYVLVSQVGLASILRVASGSDDGGPAIYSYAWLLIQVPYGVLGVSLLTALMPRMSAAAANGRIDQVVADLSLGSRLSTVTLLPVSALLTVFGSQLGVALFSIGRSGPEGAASLGGAMAASAFGLLPMAVVMLQMRVFYAMNDARTPTLIMVVITALKVPMAYLCPVFLAPEQVVLGLAAVNAFGFVVGLVVGNIWLRVRLGHLDTRRVLRTFVLTLIASLVSVLVAVLCVTLLERVLGSGTSPVLQAWLVLVTGSAVFLAAVAVAMRLLKVPELDPVVSRLRRLLGRGRARAS
ncbi:murein biosynthesis integral membrane protein MurJ [Actinomycetospora straminea]|uniref:Murein biosynthesis integral membrane protein MurJ n=1 Tax=Actinomycetospora straminea TaxID=663607 RepID=A0ABP9ED46_9PSEU|nr:murein biosynthesis integral membrane protein MurJ [Actinomycetospora straminea]MDD7936782.1 murein biosynthesis integral membrane protein MurJ [Actinomycetospora straminea]